MKIRLRCRIGCRHGPSKSAASLDIVGRFKSFSSLSDTPPEFARPTTSRRDYRPGRDISRPTQIVPQNVIDALRAVIIGQSIPRRPPDTSPYGGFLAPPESKNSKEKHMSSAEQLRAAQNTHPRDIIFGGQCRTPRSAKIGAPIIPIYTRRSLRP